MGIGRQAKRGADVVVRSRGDQSDRGFGADQSAGDRPEGAVSADDDDSLAARLGALARPDAGIDAGGDLVDVHLVAEAQPDPRLEPCGEPVAGAWIHDDADLSHVKSPSEPARGPAAAARAPLAGPVA